MDDVCPSLYVSLNKANINLSSDHGRNVASKVYLYSDVQLLVDLTHGSKSQISQFNYNFLAAAPARSQN